MLDIYMRKEDEMLLIADELQAIGIQQMIVELKDDCLDSEKVVQLLHEFSKYAMIHDTRVRDLAMYKEKIYLAREKYASISMKYQGLLSRNKELTDKLSTKFDNI